MTEDIRKYDFIDALRGYAILLVLLVHSSQSVTPINQTLQLLMSNGARGIQLFYIASALTLCMSWRFRSKHEISPFRDFFLRRFFRIAPMFYVAIVFYVLLYGFSLRYGSPNGIEWWFVPLTALFLHGFHPETITSVVPGGWSIAVEMNFYLVLPLLLHHLT
ncbi:MAG: acyltransferase family protein, partial [Deltaproteobacteria bacterium]|nr:acyltransferase family protein [Deltaproteobacteria bacterium]